MPGKMIFKYDLPPGITELAERFPKAANAVLNRTGKETKTQWAGFITQHFNVKSARVKERISMIQSTWTTLSVVIKVQSKKFPMMDFVVSGKRATARRGTRPEDQQPVAVEIIRGKRTTLNEAPFPGQQGGGKAFIAKGGAQGFQVRRRETEKRLPITLWRYIHPVVFFKNEQVWKSVVEFSRDRLMKEMPRVIKAWVEQGKQLS